MNFLFFLRGVQFFFTTSPKASPYYYYIIILSNLPVSKFTHDKLQNQAVYFGDFDTSRNNWIGDHKEYEYFFS